MSAPAADNLRREYVTAPMNVTNDLLTAMLDASDLLEAIGTMHRKVIHLTTGDVTVCPTCDDYGGWPCDTARLIYPDEQTE